MPVRTVIERGPKQKRAVAFALDWPGWSRGAKSADAALETLESYRARYRPVAHLAGLGRSFDRAGRLDVVEDRAGTSSTDFWGISFSPATAEQRESMTAADLDRAITLLRACWAYFDEVAARVSPEMRAGPRGGGRDRERIIRHAINSEREQFARKVGLRVPEDAVFGPDGVRRFRDDYVAAIRAYNAGEVRRMRTWTLPFLLRHSAYHVLDHAWEMEDKDLTNAAD